MKTCKSENCNRKFERTSLSELCPACASAFKAGQTQTQRRMGNTTRQTQARSSSYDNNRDLTVSPPHTQQQPTASLPTQATPGIDIERLQTTFNSLGAGSSSGTEPNHAMKDMFGMMLYLCSKSGETEQMKTQLSTNTHRLDRIEARIGGNPDDIAVPLSLAINNLPIPAPGTEDIELVKALLREVNAPNVDVEKDILRVVRRGATEQNQGSVMVEMSSDETRASVMKSKWRLETHPNPGLRKVIIRNMKERHELKVDIALNQMLKLIPGGENLYIANNGNLREKNVQQRNHQNNLNANFQPILPRPAFRANSNPQNNQHPPFNPSNPNRLPNTNFQPRQNHFNQTNLNLQPNQVPQSTTSLQPNQAQALFADANLIQFNIPANISTQIQPPNPTGAQNQNVLPNPPVSNTFPTWSFPPPPLPVPTQPSISQPLAPPPTPAGFVFTGASQPHIAPVSGSHSAHVIPGASGPVVVSDHQAPHGLTNQGAASQGSPGHESSANQE